MMIMIQEIVPKEVTHVASPGEHELEWLAWSAKTLRQNIAWRPASVENQKDSEGEHEEDETRKVETIDKAKVEVENRFSLE